MTSPKPMITWTDEALAEATAAASAALPNETGGILVGWYVGDDIHVEQFVAVPDPRAHRFGYVRRVRAANAVLQEHRADDERLGYVGEWHSHPAPAGPSAMDLLSLRSMALRSPEPVGLVVLARQRDGWTTHQRIARRPRWRHKEDANG